MTLFLGVWFEERLGDKFTCKERREESVTMISLHSYIDLHLSLSIMIRRKEVWMWHNRDTEHAGWTMHTEWVSFIPRPSHCMKEEVWE